MAGTWSNPEWYAFDYEHITVYAPAQSGVYMIIDERSTAIYSGEGHDIQDRLLQYYDRYSDQSTCIWQHFPIQWSLELHSAVMRVARESLLIAGYRPLCNV